MTLKVITVATRIGYGCTVHSMNQFDPEKEEWTRYVERLDHFFVANGIENVEKKRAILSAGHTLNGYWSDHLQAVEKPILLHRDWTKNVRGTSGHVEGALQSKTI